MVSVENLSRDVLSLTGVSEVQVLLTCKHIESTTQVGSSLSINVSEVFISTMCCLQAQFFPCNDVFTSVLSSTASEVSSFFKFFIGYNINNVTYYKKALNKILLFALNMLTLQGYMSDERIIALYFV